MEKENTPLTIRKVNACRAWQMMLIYAGTAGGMTLTNLWTAYGSLTLAGAAFGMLMAAVTRKRQKKSNPANNLLLGDVCWLAGLGLQGATAMLWQTVGLLIACMGAGLYFSGMHLLRPVMKNVYRFANVQPKPKQDQLTGVTALCVSTASGLVMHLLEMNVLVRVLALLSTACTMLATFNFPLDKRYIKKLNTYLTRTDAGENLPERKRQLEKAVIEKHRQPFLIRGLISIIRVFYPHKLYGMENYHRDDENPVIFLVNHGDLYGPIASFLFLPCYVHSWSISYLTTDVKTGEDYIYKYDTSQMKWLLPPLQRPLANLISRFALWGLTSLEAISVYRDQPTKLIRTFRAATDIMICGDSMLIFPENPNAAGQDHGYEKHEIAELFSGFAMVAPIYYNKTGKLARFLPVYADQTHRAMHFGTEIVYDPDRNVNEERQRISDEAARQLKAFKRQCDAQS